MDRLFVPLASAPFQWFGDGRKLWELRAMRGQFTPKHVREGRRVELRRGYSTGDSLWGTIAEIVEATGIRQFFGAVPWQEVLPESTDKDCSILAAHCILKVGGATPVIGFKVKIEGRFCGSCAWNRSVLVGAPCVKCQGFSEWVEP